MLLKLCLDGNSGLKYTYQKRKAEGQWFKYPSQEITEKMAVTTWWNESRNIIPDLREKLLVFHQ